jgi:hypothetical protein
MRSIIFGTLCQKLRVIKSWRMRDTQNLNYIIRTKEREHVGDVNINNCSYSPKINITRDTVQV